MKNIFRTAALVFAVAVLLAAGSGTVWAKNSCGNDGVAGIWLGNTNTGKEVHWSFSLVNLTSKEITITTQDDSDDRFTGKFPYIEKGDGQSTIDLNTYYPGNSDPDKKYVGHTTWKSNDHTELFPDHCRQHLIFNIANDTAYNFGMVFDSDIEYEKKRAVIAQFLKPEGASTWKYSTNTTSQGYYAMPPRAGNEGVLFAISDKYILCAYLAGKDSNGLVVVVTERDPNLDYHGNKAQWFM